MTKVVEAVRRLWELLQFLAFLLDGLIKLPGLGSMSRERPSLDGCSVGEGVPTSARIDKRSAGKGTS